MATLFASGDKVLLHEDALDLAEWRSRPPVIQSDGKFHHLSQVPPCDDWIDREATGDGGLVGLLRSAAGFMGG